jgi:glycosyl transferase family 25
MFEFVQHVVYINLDKRTDRRETIESELAPYFPSEKITRFSAIKNENGAIGAAESHIAVLEMAKAAGWKNVLILEDDAVWSRETFEEGYATLERLTKEEWDAIVLGGHNTTWDTSSLRLIQTFGAEACLINSHYYDILLNNYKESKSLLETHGRPWEHGLDVRWNQLHIRDRWFVVVPVLMKQIPGYSDIRGQIVGYYR